MLTYQELLSENAALKRSGTVAVLQAKDREIAEKERELRVVTQERDNALLRIEELEAERASLEEDLEQANTGRRTDFVAGPGAKITRPEGGWNPSFDHNGPESSYRGGVHPNA